MTTTMTTLVAASATTTETTTSIVLVVPVVRLEGCMGLLVSDAAVFSVSAGAVAVRKAVLARAAGEMNADYVEVSIVIHNWRRLVGTSSCRKL